VGRTVIEFMCILQVMDLAESRERNDRGPQYIESRAKNNVRAACACSLRFRNPMQHHHGRIAAAPVFFVVVGGGNDGLRGFGGLSTMGSPAAILSAFHLSQAGVPAASITLAKMADDHLPSIVKVFFDPSSNSMDKLDSQVSSSGFGILLTSIAIVGLAY